jgi:flagellar FliL protein
MALKMQDGLDEDESEEIEEVKVKKFNPRIFRIVGLIILLALIGYAVKVYLPIIRHARQAPTVIKVGEVVLLDEFMMNLADPGDDHYIKTTIALGLKQGVTGDEFKDKIAASRDAIVLVLSSEKLEDVSTLQGKIALKQQIKDAVNQAIGENDVAAVYYEDFATQ